MNLKLTFLILFIYQFGFSQQYDSVIMNADPMDENNVIYKPGNVFIYDYEIIHHGKPFKLKKNDGTVAEIDFQLVAVDTDSLGVDKIHLIVKPVVDDDNDDDDDDDDDDDRTNDHQTEISYLQGPAFSGITSTGAVENDKNVWIHPIRAGFFNALETAPFPYVQKPLDIGKEWTDQMLVHEDWGNKMWGEWKGQLLETYTYKIVAKETLDTALGASDCFVIESTASSTLGETHLKTYFSETYGFVRMDYVLLNDLKVNLWLIDAKTGIEFNDSRTFLRTKAYIKP